MSTTIICRPLSITVCRNPKPRNALTVCFLLNGNGFLRPRAMLRGMVKSIPPPIGVHHRDGAHDRNPEQKGPVSFSWGYNPLEVSKMEMGLENTISDIKKNEPFLSWYTLVVGTSILSRKVIDNSYMGHVHPGWKVANRVPSHQTNDALETFGPWVKVFKMQTGILDGCLMI